ncbi:MAG: alpha/beta fold hydrolase [Pseudomonadota bacterium]
MANKRHAFFDGIQMPGDQPIDPHYLPPPAPWLALTEPQRVVLEVASLTTVRALLKQLPKGDGHPVMVFPGFLGSDGYNATLRRFLRGQGYPTYGWGLGTNLGPRGGVLEKLLANLDEVYRRHGQPVSLIGHSLGGIYARELAREQPDKVRQAISLGSPFGRGRNSASYPARLFEALNPEDEIPISIDELHRAPPVPTTAIYSRGDGIVNWRTSRQHWDFAHSSTQSIQVRGSHCGMTLNPIVWYIISDRLQTSAENWSPFEVRKYAKLLVPRHL